MKTTITAASTRDKERMSVVRMALDSEGLDQPGGRKLVSLPDDGAGVVARSSMGWSEVEVEEVS
jgi:hypothetical protein